MRAMINRLTGNRMWVHESRVDEYLAAGHKLAAVSSKPAKAKAPIMPKPEAPKVEEVTKEEQVEKPVKKVTAKRGKR